MWDKLKEQFNLLKLEKKKLCLITNSDKFESKDLFLDAIASALQGGVDIVILRELAYPDNVVVEIASKLRILCDEYGATFIVNNRSDIAMIVEADGVHLGQNDISPQDARTVLGENAIIGKSTHNPDEVIQAVNEGVDYITFEPIADDKFVVEEYMLWVNENIDVPVFLAGEINLKNINNIIQKGTKRIALTNAIMYAQVPEDSARKMLMYLP
ncbi:thiamine-phosphate pyrophosphorylase [Clostridium sp. CAG:813]|nr:thiamine-phosphate pyrophosphorylase [Clostridium sp. CAG:813]